MRPRPAFRDFVTRVLTTPQGWWLIVVGCGVGFLFALVALCISVVSFPLMLDRHAGAGEAMVTSLRAVARNPVPMAAWGLIVAVLLVAGIAAVLPRPCRRDPAARPRHLASLSRGDRTGTQSAAAAAPRAARATARGGFPGQPVPVAAQGQRIGLTVPGSDRTRPPVDESSTGGFVVRSHVDDLRGLRRRALRQRSLVLAAVAANISCGFRSLMSMHDIDFGANDTA